jgi:phage gpG-like protein
MSVTVNISNLEIQKALADISKYEKKTQIAITNQVKASTLKVASHAKKIVPVQTGRLRASIRTMFTANFNRGVVSTNVEYAAEVEYGSRVRNRRPKPYMRPAAKKERPIFIRRIKLILAKVK